MLCVRKPSPEAIAAFLASQANLGLTYAQVFAIHRTGTGRISLVAAHVSAGFPSPADDYIKVALDLHQHLVRHPAATFTVRVQGNSMHGAGIHHGDLLIVDRSLNPAAAAWSSPSSPAS